MRILFIVYLVAVLLSGCATSYKERGLTGGYSETQLDENVFRVSFRGNGYTSKERASDFNLLRSAELTLEKGYRYFIIVDSQESVKLSTYTTPTISDTDINVYQSGNHFYGDATTTTYGGQTYIYSKPSTTNTIICFKEKPQVNGLVFDADFVANSIRQKYTITN